MSAIPNLLSEIHHRPFALPTGSWQYYQEWNKALFLHWKIPFDELRKSVPERLELDTFESEAYISLVAFQMQKIRPKHLPAVKFISDFEEINLRTYVINDGKAGVYFLNIEAEKYLSAFVAKKLSGLPYEKSNIFRKGNRFSSQNTFKKFHLEAEFEAKEKLQTKTGLDHWLTERYCLYLEDRNQLFRFDIHHKEWEIRNVEIKKLSLSYELKNNYLINSHPDLIHYSEGVKVLAWSKVRI